MNDPNFQIECTVQQAKIGKGVFALEAVIKDRVVWSLYYDHNDTQILKLSEIMSLPEHQRDTFICYCWQESDQTFTGCTGCPYNDWTNYLNHSCDPNLYFFGDQTLVACRDIRPGEELTIDYGTCDSTFSTMTCLCGSSYCRKQITNSDYLFLYHKYGRRMKDYLYKRAEQELINSTN